MIWWKRGNFSARLIAPLLPFFAVGADAARRQSVEVAERAVRSSPRRDPSILDTLAAAYAAAGRFDEAVDVAEEASRLARKAGASTLAEEIRDRRDLYVQNRSYSVPLEGTGVSSSDVRRKR